MNEIEKSFKAAEAMTGSVRVEWAGVICGLVNTMKANLEGLVVRTYDSETDDWTWTFGSAQWKRLHQPGTKVLWDDDPLKDIRDPVPLSEFLTYLHDWYWPRRKLMAIDTVAPGIHLVAAREVAA